MASSTQKKAALQEVQDALSREARRSRTDAALVKKYLNSKLEFFGLPVPAQRKINNSGFCFLERSEREVLSIWDYIWHNSDNFEVMSQPLIYYGHKSRQTFLPEAWPVLSRWSVCIENWAHSDGLSSLYVRILEEAQKDVFPTLLRWNTSKHLWLRRQSVVSLLYYSSARRSVMPFEQLIPLVKKLLHDDEYYVQKGVGWTLRELSNVHPAKTRKFLLEHAVKIHPAAFTAAIEKLSVPEKARLKEMRKLHRKKA